jgi:molybdopterin-containing oxidoreductase family iron-sulfur binding subunit
MHDQHDPIELDEQPLRSWDEFPPGADEMPELSDGVSRRAFMQRMAASFALAGLAGAGCTDRPNETIVPYVQAPEGVVPGKPLVFASAMNFNGYAKGVLVTSREGRPIKIEGNPDHPATLGAADVFMQASILDLYDPNRAQAPTRGGFGSEWTVFWQVFNKQLAELKKTGGEGFRVLSGPITSPTLIAEIDAFSKQYPKAKWHVFDPVAKTNRTAGTVAAFGRPLNVTYDFSKAKTIVSLDNDFLFEESASVRYSRQFMDGRRVWKDRAKDMNRLYVAESSFTITGSMADHRLATRPSRVGQIAQALAAAIGVGGAGAASGLDEKTAKWIAAVADDLKASRGASLVIAGESQPAAVHALAFAINQALGSVGQTVTFTEAREYAAGDESRSLKTLTDDINANKVGTLLILSENPAFNAPADIKFGDAVKALSTAKNADGSYKNFVAHMSHYANETTFLSQWHLPETHYLEAWGDIRAFDGTVSIVQPLIAPMYSSLSAVEFVSGILGAVQPNGYELIRNYWKTRSGSGDFDAWWKDTLKAGVIKGTAAPAASTGSAKVAGVPAVSGDAVEVVFRPDYSVWDGSFARNVWLQELPRPFSKIVWDNAALFNPESAEKLGLAQNDVVKITVRGQSIEVPVALVPGIPQNTVTLTLGYGRGQQPPENVAPALDESYGASVYPIRFSDATGFTAEAKIEKTGRTQKLVRTHNHHTMGAPTEPVGNQKHLEPSAIVTPQTEELEKEVNNRRLVRILTHEEYKKKEDIVTELGGERESAKRPLLSLYPGPENGGWDYSKGYQWGMSIDQTACTGCNACIIACQAENNIPVVGKEQVDRQREMHWIRLDDYFDGKGEYPTVIHQPVPCMHCENAPCEYVCPVGATSHSEEGLNQMTYNRCVGTRYCSNNCPYKVRRFNFLDYNGWRDSAQHKLLSNPEVTVRSRGVMEKCTYCVQRIQHTRIDAEKMLVDISERIRAISDEGEKARLKEEAAKKEFAIVEGMQTACQQSCPTQAIVFGSINKVGGQETFVMKAKNQPLDYSLLRELTTKPRTTYMARVRNPNPVLEQPKAAAAEGGHA